MQLNSVNTNVAAQVALQSLNKTNADLQADPKRISTGYRVADATDDGAAFAVAQRVRADVGALTTVNSQLGNAKGLVTTALSGLTSISSSLNDAKSLLVQIADASISQTQRDQYVSAYKTLVQRVANTVDGSTYNGQTLLGAASGTVAATNKTVINNESGATSVLSSEDVSGLASTLAGLIGATFSRSATGSDTWTAAASGADQTAAALALSATSGTTSFVAAQTGVANQLNQAGSDSQVPGCDDHLQQLQDRQPQRRSRRAGRRGPEQGIGEPAGAADPAAAGHAGTVYGEPSATGTAQPVPLTRRTSGGGASAAGTSNRSKRLKVCPTSF